MLPARSCKLVEIQEDDDTNSPLLLRCTEPTVTGNTVVSLPPCIFPVFSLDTEAEVDELSNRV